MTLNKRHKYYSQVQFQMGLSGQSWCYFLVFTQKCLQDGVNLNIVTVNFDKGSFDSLVSTSVKFWFGHFLTEVLTRRICHESESSTVNYSKEECDVSRPQVCNVHR